MNVLALDFDGVICDSAGEVLQTALGAWSTIFPGSQLQSLMEEGPEIKGAFNRLVPLGNRAEDFGVALHILENDLEIHGQEAYDRIRTTLGPRWLERFHQEFYRARERLRTENPERWFGLHRTYPLFIDALRRHQQDATYSIITAKDGGSVRRLLKHFAIDHLFPADLILDKETGIAKTANLEILLDRLECNPPHITFVDDKLNHLVTTASLGVRGVLAAWGHNTEREHRAARNRGFEVATLETAEAVVFGR